MSWGRGPKAGVPLGRKAMEPSDGPSGLLCKHSREECWGNPQPPRFERDEGGGILEGKMGCKKSASEREKNAGKDVGPTPNWPAWEGTPRDPEDAGEGGRFRPDFFLAGGPVIFKKNSKMFPALG